MQLENIKILLVEDSGVDQRLFKEMLVDTDIDNSGLITCEDLKTAEEILFSEKIDIILLDFFLPDSIGLDSLGKLKQSFPSIPVVIITGLDDKSVATDAINKGAQDYLIKGEFNPELLQKTLHYAIQRHKISAELAQINKRLDSFVYTVSHDLRGPVKNLKALMEIFQNCNDNKEKINLIQHVNTSILRINEIIENLNEVLKMQNQSSPIEIIVFDQIVEEVLENFGEMINATSAKINVDFKSCPKAVATKSQIYSLLYNLIFNSLKYAKKDVSPVIDISAKKVDGFVCLSVKDNGIGIDSKYHDKIFRMFYRNNEKVDGKGIGLHIVKTIAESCGGYVDLDSVLNRGSVFNVYLKEKSYDTSKEYIAN